jgi:hypothetical protein
MYCLVARPAKSGAIRQFGHATIGVSVCVMSVPGLPERFITFIASPAIGDVEMFLLRSREKAIHTSKCSLLPCGLLLQLWIAGPVHGQAAMGDLLEDDGAFDRHGRRPFVDGLWADAEGVGYGGACAEVIDGV